MAEEARHILTAACAADEEPRTLVDIAQELFGPALGVELELPERAIGREPPSFD